MPERPPPVAQALLLADFIHRDARNGKYDVYGVFNLVSCPCFPATLPDPWVYVALTEIYGPTAVRVRVVSADEDEPCFSAELTASAPDPVTVVEAAFPVRGVSFSNPGLYRLQLVADEVVIAERRFQLIATDHLIPGPDAALAPDTSPP
jgi:hypothetical protein